MLALTWYEWFKAFHVLTAVVWVGGAVMISILAFLISREGDPVRLAQFGRVAGLVGERLLTTMSVLVLLFGVGLMENGASPWEWDMTFISISLLGWIAAFLLGSIWTRAQSASLRRVLAASGPGAPEAQVIIRRVVIGARLNAVLLLFVVFVMTAKPWW